MFGQLREINGKLGGAWSGLCDLEITTHPLWASVSSFLSIAVVSEFLSHARPCTPHSAPVSHLTSQQQSEVEVLRASTQVIQGVPRSDRVRIGTQVCLVPKPQVLSIYNMRLT